jgi:cyclase
VRRIAKNVFTEIYSWGCNPSALVTSDGVALFDTPQQPNDAVRWREALQEHGPIRYLINTEPHNDHIRGNAFFPGVEVIGQSGMPARYEAALPVMTGNELLETMKQTDPDSVWLFNHPNYPPNPPTRTFEDELTLHLGNHTLRCIHLPGHTAPQTAIHIPEENVVVTGDNVFSGCKTFIQEAKPWEWLDSLKRIGQLGAAVIIPGHGEPVDNSYLRVQAEVIEGWVEAVRDFMRRGLTADEALQQPAPAVDPYPPGQRLFAMEGRINAMNVSNLYKQLAEREQTAQPA